MLPVGRIKQLKSLVPAAPALVLCLLTLLTLTGLSSLQSAQAGRPAAMVGASLSAAPALAASVYPQFKSNVGTIHWLKEQMPLKVYISHGTTLDSVMDPALGAPIANIDNLPSWPKLVAALIERPEKWKTLTQAGGFLPGHYQAAKEGVLAWKMFEPEGLIKYQLTDDPEEADIYVFFTHHFVTKLGMALFANDIRGYTSKTNFSYAAVMRGAKANFQPVVCVLRTTDNQGQPMPLGKMKAAAMHEFGHALGIEGHSTNNGDLMSIYYGRGVISPNDADTLRYLYHLTPDLIP